MKKQKGNFDRDDFISELDKKFGAGNYELSTDNSTVTIDNKDYDTGILGKFSKDEKIAMKENNITEVEEENIANDNLKDTNKIKAVIKDEDNSQIPIPVDAEYVEGKENTGLVIRYKNSEFVWIPVPVTADNNLYAKGTTKSMARKTDGSKDANNRFNYKGVIYKFSGTGASTTSVETTDYIEPSALEYAGLGDWCADGYTLIKTHIEGMSGKTNEEIQVKWRKQLQEEYNAMIESVTKYGGFFVGRYESSLNGTKVASVANKIPLFADDEQAKTWYGQYQKLKEFTSSSDKMQSNMMWDSQYDALFNWALQGDDKVKVNSKGNALHNLNRSTLLTRTTTETDTITETDTVNGLDRINNVYDLEGSAFEWTQGVNQLAARSYRGGGYSGAYAPAARRQSAAYIASQYNGGRLSLHIK